MIGGAREGVEQAVGGLLDGLSKKSTSWGFDEKGGNVVGMRPGITYVTAVHIIQGGKSQSYHAR